MNGGRKLIVAAVVGLAFGSFSACGSDGSEVTTNVSEPAAAHGDFPAPKGQTVVGFAKDIGLTQDIVVSPAGQTYEPGRNRFSFGVFNADGSQVEDAKVAIYIGRGPDGEAEGPFPAAIESLETTPAFASQTAAAEAQPVTAAYVSNVQFDRPGEWRVVAVVEQDSGAAASLLPSVEVNENRGIPDVGTVPPKIETPTVRDVGDISEIETRLPPDTMHSESLDEVLGEKATVLLFATPALCMSRVCGPMVDIAEQVHSESSTDVAFIHMEVYNDNDPSKGLRPELKAFGLQTEPWLFVMDASGRIRTRIEGAFSAAELEAAIARAERGS
jgi:hypothetical protein